MGVVYYLVDRTNKVFVDLGTIIPSWVDYNDKDAYSEVKEDLHTMNIIKHIYGYGRVIHYIYENGVIDCSIEDEYNINENNLNEAFNNKDNSIYKWRYI